MASKQFEIWNSLEQSKCVGFKKGIREVIPFSMEIDNWPIKVMDSPHQIDLSCGVYTSVFAEHLSRGKNVDRTPR